MKKIIGSFLFTLVFSQIAQAQQVNPYPVSWSEVQIQNPIEANGPQFLAGIDNVRFGNLTNRIAEDMIILQNAVKGCDERAVALTKQLETKTKISASRFKVLNRLGQIVYYSDRQVYRRTPVCVLDLKLDWDLKFVHLNETYKGKMSVVDCKTDADALMKMPEVLRATCTDPTWLKKKVELSVLKIVNN